VYVAELDDLVGLAVEDVGHRVTGGGAGGRLQPQRADLVSERRIRREFRVESVSQLVVEVGTPRNLCWIFA
jgi:hypothetical protein